MSAPIPAGTKGGHTAPNGTPPECARCGARHMAVCGALETHEFPDLAAITRHRAIKSGDVVFEEGDHARHVFTLSAGVLKLYKLLPNGRRLITGFLYPGDFLGLAGNNAYVYGAQAITDGHLCQFEAGAFRALMARHPALKDNLLAKANDELRHAQDQMLLLGRKTPTARLASFLLRLAAANARYDRPTDVVTLPMTREDIADFLGLTIETVSRTFTKLKTDGVIALPNRARVEIKDITELSMMAEDY